MATMGSLAALDQYDDEGAGVLPTESVRAYQPSWRERIAQGWLGDNPSLAKQNFVEGVTGSRGLTRGVGLMDFVPVLGSVLGAQEALNEGQYREAGINVLPGAGPLKGAGKAAAKGMADVLGETGAEIRQAMPTILSRAEPTAGDVQAIKNMAKEYGHKPWPEARREVFKTTPEAYAETTAIVPQYSIRGDLPGPLPGEKLPAKGRTEPIIQNRDAIAARIAEKLDPLVRRNDPLLKFYHTGPVIRGLEQHGELPLEGANRFMLDWSGQGAATSPRTSTPPNLRNASFLLHERARGAPLDPARFAAEGNTPGYGMMGMHVNLADLFARGQQNPWVNPKPSTFRENWRGNLADVTADTHNIRSTLFEMDQLKPGSLPRGWFTSDEAYERYLKDGFPSARNIGDIADTLSDVTVKKVRRQSEYLPMADPWYGAAQKLGIHPAEAQSGGWFTYGPQTGLRSPPKTITNLLNDQIDATARVLDVPNEKVVKWWAQGKIPLSGIGGVGLMSSLAAQDNDRM